MGLVSLVLLTPGIASADIITQTRAFDLSLVATTGGGGDADALLFDRFDTSLGTLNRVDVTIDATLLMQLQLPASFVQQFGVVVPVSYSFDLRASLDFGGQASDFLVVPEVMLNGTAPGGALPMPLVATVGVHHIFSYTETTDLAGLAPVNTTYAPTASSLGAVATIPAGLSSGVRQDFVAPVADVPLVVTPTLLLSSPLLAGAVLAGTFGGTVTAQGQFSITYDYTPTPVSAPEPGTAMLLGGGLLALAATRRRRPNGRPAQSGPGAS